MSNMQCISRQPLGDNKEHLQVVLPGMIETWKTQSDELIKSSRWAVDMAKRIKSTDSLAHWYEEFNKQHALTRAQIISGKFYQYLTEVEEYKDIFERRIITLEKAESDYSHVVQVFQAHMFFASKKNN